MGKTGSGWPNAPACPAASARARRKNPRSIISGRRSRHTSAPWRPIIFPSPKSALTHALLRCEPSSGDLVAHALVRAASALVPTPAAAQAGVATSLDTARRSACATNTARLFLSTCIGVHLRLRMSKWLLSPKDPCCSRLTFLIAAPDSEANAPPGSPKASSARCRDWPTDHNAVNLAQGFPDFAAPAAPKGRRAEGDCGRYQSVRDHLGREAVSRCHRRQVQAHLRDRARSGARNYGLLRRHRRDDGVAAGRHQSGRRSGDFRATLRKLWS